MFTVRLKKVRWGEVGTRREETVGVCLPNPRTLSRAPPWGWGDCKPPLDFTPDSVDSNHSSVTLYNSRLLIIRIFNQGFHLKRRSIEMYCFVHKVWDCICTSRSHVGGKNWQSNIVITSSTLCTRQLRPWKCRAYPLRERVTLSEGLVLWLNIFEEGDNLLLNPLL